MKLKSGAKGTESARRISVFLVGGIAAATLVCACGPPRETDPPEREHRRGLFVDRAIPPDREAVREALSSPDPLLQGEGAYMAARHGYSELAELIRENFAESGWYVRYHSLSALKRFDHPAARPLALQVIDDPNRSLRIKALEVLAAKGKPEDYYSVRDRLRDENEIVRAMAVFALGQMEIARAVPDLIPNLESTRPLIREEAYAALKRISGLDLPPEPEIWTRWWKERRTDNANAGTEGGR